MVDRTPEDILAGILRISVGGQEKLVPTLSIGATREWQRQLGHGQAGFVVPISDDDWTAASMAEFSGLTIETILDVVTTYDTSGALGGREWLEAHADPAQLYAAAVQMIEVAFPFATDPPVVLQGLVVLRTVDQSAPASYTSGRSHTGGSTRGRSRSASTRAS